MPTYDVVLLLKKMTDAHLKEALTRNAKYILETGGNLRRMDNLGLQQTPYSMTSSKQKGKWAHYFIMNYDAGTDQNRDIMDKFKRDMDVLRSTSFLQSKMPGGDIAVRPKRQCTIYEDLLPPPMRPKVQELLKTCTRGKKEKFEYGGGLDYDPL